MAIRLRRVQGRLVALCAARSVEKPDDIYLDDEVHQALSTKFGLDWNSTRLWEVGDGGDPARFHLPFDAYEAHLIGQEESNNANRTWWDATYG